MVAPWRVNGFNIEAIGRRLRYVVGTEPASGQFECITGEYERSVAYILFHRRQCVLK